MPRLAFSDGAADDLAEIAAFIAEASGSAEVARKVLSQLVQRCVDLAALPGTMGRARDDLAPSLRSATFGNYVIVFSYEGDVMRITGVFEGHRDVARALSART